MAPGCGDAERLAHGAANIPETSSSTQARTDLSARCDNKRARPAAANGRPVEIVIDRLIDNSDNDILDELRRVAALVKARELTVLRFTPLARISYSTVQKRFGCWPAALVKAGLGHRRSQHFAADRRRAIATTAMTDRQIVHVLRAIARRKKSKVLIRRDVEDDDRLSLSMLRRRFGSWPAVLAAAGLRRSRCGQKHSRQACLDNLIAVARHTGRIPRWHDLQRPPSLIGAPAYRRHFGSWKRALKVLVEQLNAAARRRSGDQRGLRPVAAKRKRLDPRRSRLAAARRRVAPAMRFRILARDRFRCVLCGDSPAVDPRCKLHVDHIVPFSKGGRTTSGNLRTLCAACNIGRGNRREDGKEAG